ncbi:uncharacterized protein BT62DRAFT_1013678 [Guyanagaster necrorhizus]|uniref:Uncharacterized protein n=1 Tax=Guyanagaster necrorhizus TaxID=856835 RepID=A0A9P7VFI7_9AGAR|nr:uncharacterized protein BT62DRAFT_1013678 [Guyanagaster necrorhizus MCA 3950]KAG7439637.1 hypothetical protein BT62DRAFT_1013678 [Guyanagaster necrorhizus MCA 3950]
MTSSLCAWQLVLPHRERLLSAVPIARVYDIWSKGSHRSCSSTMTLQQQSRSKVSSSTVRPSPSLLGLLPRTEHHRRPTIILNYQVHMTSGGVFHAHGTYPFIPDHEGGGGSARSVRCYVPAGAGEIRFPDSIFGTEKGFSKTKAFEVDELNAQEFANAAYQTRRLCVLDDKKQDSPLSFLATPIVFMNEAARKFFGLSRSYTATEITPNSRTCDLPAPRRPVTELLGLFWPVFSHYF